MLKPVKWRATFYPSFFDSYLKSICNIISYTMTPSEQKIAAFESRVRQLILRFQELKKENSALSAQIEASEKQIADLQARLGQAGRDYDSLKMAKMMEITNGDLESARVRLSKLIRDVNKCITVLSDEQ